MRYFMVLCALLAAGSANASEKPANGEANGMPQQVEMTFRIDGPQTVTRGETVRFVFDVHNGGDEAVQLGYTFPPHGVSVTTPAGEIAWQAFAGQMFPQVMRYEEISAGATQSFSVEWQADVPAGEYGIEPAFTGFVGRKPLARQLEPATIVVAERKND